MEYKFVCYACQDDYPCTLKVDEETNCPTACPYEIEDKPKWEREDD